MVRVGVLGVGVMGNHHARLYSEMAGVELVGVYDNDDDRASEAAARYGCKRFSDPFSMFAEVDAVSICTPASNHYKAAMAAMCCNDCHVLVEKPMATNSADAEKMAKRALGTNRVLHVGHVERFNPQVQKLRESCDNSEWLDFIRTSNAGNRGQDISVVFDLMIHDIDIALMLRQEKPVSVWARSTGDCNGARLEFENGATCWLTADRHSPTPMRLAGGFNLSDIGDANPLRDQLAAFIGEINGTPSDIAAGALDGVRAVAVAEMIEKALAEG